MDHIQTLLNWIKTKKATINPINKKDKLFKNAVTVTLNYKEIEKEIYRIT